MSLDRTMIQCGARTLMGTRRFRLSQSRKGRAGVRFSISTNDRFGRVQEATRTSVFSFFHVLAESNWLVDIIDVKDDKVVHLYGVFLLLSRVR